MVKRPHPMKWIGCTWSISQLCSLFILGLLTGCSTGFATLQVETLKIGAVLPLNGYGAQTGENSLNGYRLAIEEVNRQGGVIGRPIELVVADHAGDDTKGAVSAYHSLRQKDIALILGPNFSPLGQAIAPIACEDGVLLISPAIGIKDFTTPCSRIFNLWPSDEENSRLMGRMVASSGYARIAIVGSVQSWEMEQAQAVKEGVESSNATIAEYFLTDNLPGDYLSEATRIIGSSPDAIIFTNYGYMDLVARRLRELGSEADFFVIVMDESRRKNSNGAFEGARGITSFTPTTQFIEVYNRTFGQLPDFNADTSYDAVMLIAKAIQESGSADPKLVAEGISKLKSYNGASGNLTFTSIRTVTKPPVFQIVINESIRQYRWEQNRSHKEGKFS